MPDDYEFLTLRKEIGLGYTLEQLEYHWIGPEQDKKLQAGLDKDADEKQHSIAGIIKNEEQFNKLKCCLRRRTGKPTLPSAMADRAEQH